MRRKVLDALLRFMAAASEPLLAEILQHYPCSAHLATMLATTDIHIQAAALQIVQLLSAKLPDIFNVFFRRKGVVHQVYLLAQSTSHGAQCTSHEAPSIATPPTTDGVPIARASSHNIPLAALAALTDPSLRKARRRARPGQDDGVAGSDGDLSGPVAPSREPDVDSHDALAVQAAKIFQNTFGLQVTSYQPLLDPHVGMDELRSLTAIVTDLDAAPDALSQAAILNSLGLCLGNPARAASFFEAEHSNLFAAISRFLHWRSAQAEAPPRV